MNEQTLRTLCRQLATWAQSAIDDGGYPYRKVELFPSLMTASGPLSPPMVFWINRDSLLAGGIVFFPDNLSVEQIDVSVNAAAALGIDHFTTWDLSAITFWKIVQGKASAIRTLPARLPTTASPADYHSLLLQLLGTVKVMAVGGILPPELISPYYLANLFHSTIQSALPLLRDQHRRERANSPQPVAVSPDDAAETKAIMSLLRLVGLVGFDRLPTSVQPEGLEHASKYALETLPVGLQPALAVKGAELPLSRNAAIRFHHLLLRLTQLHLDRDLTRAATALEILLCCYSRQFGDSPRPNDFHLAIPGLLLVNPAAPHSQEPTYYESAAPPLLAFFSLIREFKGLPSATEQFSDPLLIKPTIHPHAICGTLTDVRLPPLRERPLLATQLRASWPGRRWVLPPGTPRWGWELLHLLGLAAPGAKIDVATPGRWLASPFALTLLEVLSNHFCVQEISLSGTSDLRFHLIKAVGMKEEVMLKTPQGDRHLPSCRLQQAPGQVLALALTLSQPYFLLLAEGKLRPATIELSTSQNFGAHLFLQSRLGQLLTSNLVKNGALPSAAMNLLPLPTDNLLLPDPEVLENLALAFTDRATPQQREIDQELCRWLPHPPVPLSSLEATDDAPTTCLKTPRESSRTQGLEELLTRTVFSDGIPLFPDHYLFDYMHLKTARYDLPEPLSLCETFFDHAILCGATGHRLEIEGLATARALTLCSHCGQFQVRLPVDQTIMSAVLDRYLTDLRRLHHNLRQLAHQHLGSARQADNLTARIWERMHLPPSDLIES